ncbi:MAG: nuclear transport factor 2 family protein [Novosphingobium sp.]
MYESLGRGDVDAAWACLTDDASIWHSFDCVAHDRAAMREQWEATVKAFPEQALADVRRQPIENGFVQQHVWSVKSATGERKAWPCCIFVRIEGGRIARLDEYIDRAGSFEPPEGGALVTPGL